METHEQVFLVRCCAHCGDGCERAEHECHDCRFFYCERHRDPDTHDCHTVCVEVRSFEGEETAELKSGARRLRLIRTER